MATKVEKLDKTQMEVDFGGPRDVCYICGKDAVAFCDYVLEIDLENKTCDRPLCGEHTHRPFKTLGLDFCPDHCIFCRKGEK